MNPLRRWIVGWVLLACCTHTALAAAPGSVGRRATPARRSIIDVNQTIDVNNISMFVTNTGSFAFNKGPQVAGLEFPKGTGKTAVFAAGLWLGCKVGGKVRIALSEYSDEYGPGAMVGGVADDPTKAEYKVYKLLRVYPDAATRDAVLADYNSGAVPHGAPAVSVLGDGTLGISGDEMMWAVYNDADPSNHINRAGHTLPMGVEVQQTTFAFKRQGALGNTIFIKYRFINKGANTLDQMYVSQWMDPDLGGATDDLVGCDVGRSVGFVYNSTNSDDVYGNLPPSVGVDFFQGPKDALGNRLGMTSFSKYINGTDPNDSTKSYNYMAGVNPDGSPIINPVTNQVTSFQVDGDPVAGSGWLDTSPADKRMQLSSGPFKMLPGDTQEVVVGIVIGQTQNPRVGRLGSVSLMKFYDNTAQTAFDLNFNLPSPPNSPVVTAKARDGTVFLSWDASSEQYVDPLYKWEGYVVYQGASKSGPFTRIATYDLVDDALFLTDSLFNEEQGVPLPVVTAFGQNTGLRYTQELTQDAVRGGPLYNGQRYYFSVNAYAVDKGGNPQVLESAFTPVEVDPQTPAAGVDLSSAQVTDVTQSQRTVGPAPTTDVATATIVDPDGVVTADWEVGIKPPCATCAGHVWYLVRHVAAAVDTVINNWTDFAADDASPAINGVQVRMLSYPLGELARVSYSDTAGGNPAALGGAAGRGLRFFDGAADYGADYPGSSIPHGAHVHNVMVRFGPPGQLAYHYIRCDTCSSTTDLIQDFVPVPFTVWDTDVNQQLNAAFREQLSTATGVWNPDDSGSGGRYPIWVMNSAYTGVPDSATYFNNANNQDMLNGTLDLRYHAYPRRTSAGAIIDPGDKLLFTTSIPSNENDLFTFSTVAANRNNRSLAQAELDRIKAVPNPYFSHSTYELNQFTRILKFTHLPARCTIRLFTLRGDLIRTLEKNDDTSQASWDLQTSKGLPVGSGIYIFHVDAPGVGTHVGKVAVFMEKERLTNF